MPRKQIPRKTETAEIEYPPKVRILQMAMSEAIERSASRLDRRNILKKLNSALKPVDAARDAAHDASNRALDAAWDAVRGDPLYGRAYLAARRAEAGAVAAGTSFAAARIKGNQAALDVIRKSKPGYKRETWRAMRHDIEERLGKPGPPSLRRVSFNPDVATLQPGKSGPVYVYDYATPLFRQVRRIGTTPSRGWAKSLDAAIEALPISVFLHHDWLRRTLNLIPQVMGKVYTEPPPPGLHGAIIEAYRRAVERAFENYPTMRTERQAALRWPDLRKSNGSH